MKLFKQNQLKQFNLNVNQPYKSKKLCIFKSIKKIRKLKRNKKIDIDHLTRVLVFCGTPDNETLEKITCEEVI